MSVPGIRSNRGDGYQTLVAFDWALTVLSEPNCQWLEVDAVAWEVDDVVIGKSDDTLICCQCKKNETDFRIWTVASLADELDKARNLLASNPNAMVCFYSRTPFGALAKLREHCTTQANEIDYQASLSAEHKRTDVELTQCLSKTPALSSYEFLRRTTFEISPELARMESLFRERLRILTSNPDRAYDALWRRLDQLGARMEGTTISTASQHRLTKADLKTLLLQAGAMLVPPMAIADIRASFSSTSVIGRAWRRDIAGQRIANPVESELLAAIDAKKNIILLTGLPGSGKTCVMLAIQEALEQRAQTDSNLIPLFIQSREFADLATAQDRQAQGLPTQWVEQVARLAEVTHVVVIIDSLDVLSIAREHTVLSYFLAQIDRLRLIPNVTVLTACRDFDRHYDRRIAEQKWDCEFKCQPLGWDATIAPLLHKLAIAITSIDATTRQLIQNPREFALYVELAVRDGGFSVVTGHALAQRYLDTIVLADTALGNVAMHAIEGIANDMLKSRSLAVPHQRFNASDTVQRALLSHSLLHKTQDGKLMFGHQTLLDVLVISGAMRRGVTLNGFIQELSPVPFVRPSIRSFAAQLAMGERREFRKQLRTVLTGNNSFHIRRLVAESFAQQAPQDDDWPLIRELREKYRDVFQVIYMQATGFAWHFFWLKHLVPTLKAAQDCDGLRMHVHHVAQWKNDDTAGVLAFWAEAQALEWMDTAQFPIRWGHLLEDIDLEHSAALVPLLIMLINLPQEIYSELGHVVARCAVQGDLDDAVLWSYIAGDITDDDALKEQFGDKLHCTPHEFGDSNNQFLREQMKKSVGLLDLTLQTVEQWSRARIAGKNAWMAGRMGFLKHTSYSKVNNQTAMWNVGSEETLFSAMEAAILQHALDHTNWWENNRERLCMNHEGALCYFGILACTANPLANLDLIGRMLCNKELLESDLQYELGILIHNAFIYLETNVKETVLTAFLSIYEAFEIDDEHRFWIWATRAKLINTIPCHQRSPEAQSVLVAYENAFEPLDRKPAIFMRGGMVRAPFSFEVLLATSDRGLIRLLANYAEHQKNSHVFLIGSKREVGRQLCEAASRQAIRFLRLLPANWHDIPSDFRNDMLEGVANYLAYRHGNLQANNRWLPQEEPDAATLTRQILDELERHPLHWHHNRAASSALQACASIIKNQNDAERLVFLAIGFETLREKSISEDDSGDLIDTGIKMLRGHVVEALMILADQLQENGIPFPELLTPTLRRFASDEQPAIRALIIRRLPYLQSKNPALGWDLFDLALQGDATGLWEIAEPCLYYAYHDHIGKVTPVLTRMLNESTGKALETWGRISALAALANRIVFALWLKDLETLNSSDAWHGAATVWTNSKNAQRHREQCFAGIAAGLHPQNPHSAMVANELHHLFRDITPPISIPAAMLERCFSIFETYSKNGRRELYDFDNWLNATAQRDPEQALIVTELYLVHVKKIKTDLYDHKNNFTQLLTRLFAQAEEQEESDNGLMLQRVVVVQDSLLALGLGKINDWLKAAERP